MKARTDLVALIGRDLNLEPSGSVLKARSPKHRDTDPSFVVWPATQTWHDFSGGGSGGGDCLDYLVQHRGLGFMEALRTLAAETGVPMPGWSPEQAEAEAKRVIERRRIEALLTEAAGYYHRVLPSKIRRELYGRHYGFSDETIDQLQLGWGGGDLFEHLTETSRRLAARKTAGPCVRAPRAANRRVVRSAQQPAAVRRLKTASRRSRRYGEKAFPAGKAANASQGHRDETRCVTTRQGRDEHHRRSPRRRRPAAPKALRTTFR
jgi:DNA primase